MRVFISLLLVYGAFADVVTVDFLSSSHQLKDGQLLVLPQTVGNKPTGCRSKLYDGTCQGGPCDCPIGSSCVDGDPTDPYSVSMCQTQTEKLPPGTSLFDHQAVSEVSMPTQVPFLAEFTDILADGAASEGAKDKYHLIKVSIKGMEKPEKYISCSVTLSGDVVDAAQTKPVVQDTSFYYFKDNDLQANNTATCYFRPLNKGYLGAIQASITFTKDLTLIEDGENEFEKLKLRLRYVASEDDYKWHDHEFNTNDFDKVFPSHDPDATVDHFKTKDDNSDASYEVFRFNTFGGKGFDDSRAFATRGTVALPIQGIFYDTRYKIVDQTGVDSLLSGIGSAKLRKEGLELHGDFKGFADSTKNKFDNTNVKLNPVTLFTSYDKTNLHADLSEASQYNLSHMYTMTYGGYDNHQLPHFSPTYLGCEVCPGRITIKAFEMDNAYAAGSGVDAKAFQLRYHTSIDPSSLPTSANTFQVHDIEVDVTDGLWLPTTDDVVNTQGHALSELFQVKQAATSITYNSLTDDYNVLGNRITFSNGLDGTPACAGDSSKLYHYAADTTAHAEYLFHEQCKIQVDSNGQFGREMTVDYANAASKTEQAKVTEIDLRIVISGATELSLLRRKVDSAAINNGNVVQFNIKKSGVAGALEFTVKGSNTMVGYDYDGNKCTQKDSSIGCHGVMTPEEETLTTSAVDDEVVTHSIRSSRDCFRFMDIELVSTTDPWAKYALRLPCVFSTQMIDDSVKLMYHFTGQYDLATDRYTSVISFDLNNNTMTIKEAGFGTCGKDADGNDVLVPPTSCKNVDDNYKDSSESGYDGTPMHFPLYSDGQTASDGWAVASGGVF